jgi:predicted transcriptional regulator of viral defense system
MLNKNNGYLTAKAARENGIQNYTLQRMAECGMIERAAHGLYVGADIIPDPFAVAQYRCPKGVFSHETALFLHDLSDRTPLQLMMTIPSGWNTRLLSNDDLIFFYSVPKYARLGVTDIETASGLVVTSYDVERTLCDCLRSVDKLDKDLVLTALKRYMKTPGADKAKQLEYAAVFKIRDIVLRYMEVLS